MFYQVYAIFEKQWVDWLTLGQPNGRGTLKTPTEEITQSMFNSRINHLEDNTSNFMNASRHKNQNVEFSTYVGDFQNGKPHGFGTHTHQENVYKGNEIKWRATLTFKGTSNRVWGTVRENTSRKKAKSSLGNSRIMSSKRVAWILEMAEYMMENGAWASWKAKGKWLKQMAQFTGKSLPQFYFNLN